MSGQQHMDGNKPASENPAADEVRDTLGAGAGDDASGKAAGGPPGESGEHVAPPADAALALEKERAILEEQVLDLKDKLLRAHAEMDNLRKRTEREKADTAKYAITKFALDMVAINDNLTRAMDAAGAPDTHTAEVKGLYEGVALTAQELDNALERHGVVKIETEGEMFDPHLHQAMMEQPDPSVPSGTILQVFQNGYMVGERVLRPSMVVVARGGMKPKPEGADSAATPAQPETSDPAQPSEDAATEQPTGNTGPGDNPST